MISLQNRDGCKNKSVIVIKDIRYIEQEVCPEHAQSGGCHIVSYLGGVAMVTQSLIKISGTYVGSLYMCIYVKQRDK